MDDSTGDSSTMKRKWILVDNNVTNVVITTKANDWVRRKRRVVFVLSTWFAYIHVINVPNVDLQTCLLIQKNNFILLKIYSQSWTSLIFISYTIKKLFSNQYFYNRLSDNVPSGKVIKGSTKTIIRFHFNSTIDFWFMQFIN